MKILAVANQKGGSGSSTTTLNLAVAAERAGLRVILIDTDKQQSLTKWAERREAETPEFAFIDSDTSLEASLKGALKLGFDLALVDTPGADSAAVNEAIRLADLVLIPARPTIMDLEAVQSTVNAAHKLGKPMAFVVTQSPIQNSRANHARTAFEAIGMVAPVVIHYRVAYQDSAMSGLGVIEYEPDGKAAREISTLWKWLWQKLK